ncbi:MAG: hypothetical protein ACE5IL_14195 [Myxococcota bacterium]
MASEQLGIDALGEFLAAFNAQDHERLARSLHYPHIRLANGRFTRVDSPEEAVEWSRKGRSRLEAEGWHHSELESAEVVQAGDDKVHLAIRFHRCREDGTVYSRFDTLWIATLVDGHWGIQFRSSFLR